MSDPLALDHRQALPDALRALVSEFPRDAWAEHPNMSGLIAFWLDRHMMFRRLSERLVADSEAALLRKAAPEASKQQLARFGGMLINELHTHHHIEDSQYFPTMSKLDSVAERGFALLDSDHHAMDGLLSGLAERANQVLSAPDPVAFHDATGQLNATLIRFSELLERHLTDEEELVVPVLLKYDPPQFR